MFGSLAKSLFGSSNDRYVKSLNPILAKIASFEPSLQAMSDEELSAQTVKFRARLAEGEKLDDLLPEAFATVREAAHRVLGQRHYDVQMVGGIVLHRGEIAEMRTGEGKTLVATLATYLNALPGDGVHVVPAPQGQELAMAAVLDALPDATRALVLTSDTVLRDDRFAYTDFTLAPPS